MLVQADLLAKLSDSEVVDVEQLTDIEFLRRQLQADGSAFTSRFAGLSEGLCDVVENYGLLSLTSLAVEQPESVAQVVDLIDRANGFSLSGLKGHNPYPEESREARNRLHEYLHAGPGEIWAGQELAGD